MQSNIQDSNSQKGFTLIEMLVSVGLFLVVMTIVLGAVLSIIDGNKKTQAINNVSNNLSASIESMTRDIKTGYKYRCGVAQGSPYLIGTNPPDVPAGTPCDPASAVTNITFMSTISGSPRPVQYYRRRSGDLGRIYKVFCPANETDCTNPANYRTLVMTSQDIDITQMFLYVSVPAQGTGQPSVFIRMSGLATVNNSQTSGFSIQTFVSQRLLNI